MELTWAAPSFPGQVLNAGHCEKVGWTSDGEVAPGGLQGGHGSGPAGRTLKMSMNESLSNTGTFSLVMAPVNRPEEIAECQWLSETLTHSRGSLRFCFGEWGLLSVAANYDFRRHRSAGWERR